MGKCVAKALCYGKYAFTNIKYYTVPLEYSPFAIKLAIITNYYYTIDKNHYYIMGYACFIIGRNTDKDSSE